MSLNSKLKTKHSKLPFVLVNMAMSADGKIATANRALASFGSSKDHDNLLALRATADAVLAGARTVDGEKINMGPGPRKFRTRRLKNGLAEYNLRIIATGSGSLDTKAEIFRHRFSPILVLTTRRASAAKLKLLMSVAEEVKICGDKVIDFRAALRWLRTRWKVERLLCEGGGELNEALFRAGLVDEIHLTVCPKIFGGRNAPTIAEGSGFASLALAAQFRVHSQRRVGDELFLTFRRALPRPAKRNSRA